MIPDVVGVDNGDRSADAHAEAVRLGSQDDRGVLSQVGEAFFKEVPGGEADRRVTALRRRGICAEEDVLFPASDPGCSSCCFQFRVHVRPSHSAMSPNVQYPGGCHPPERAPSKNLKVARRPIRAELDRAVLALPCLRMRFR